MVGLQSPAPAPRCTRTTATSTQRQRRADAEPRWPRQFRTGAAQLIGGPAAPIIRFCTPAEAEGSPTADRV
jgi:hypothetical protein